MSAEKYIGMAFSTKVRDILSSETAPILEEQVREALDRLEGRQEKGDHWKPKNLRSIECTIATWSVVSKLIGKENALDAREIGQRAGVKTDTARGYLNKWIGAGCVTYYRARNNRFLYYRKQGMFEPCFKR